MKTFCIFKMNHGNHPLTIKWLSRSPKENITCSTVTTQPLSPSTRTRCNMCILHSGVTKCQLSVSVPMEEIPEMYATESAQERVRERVLKFSNKVESVNWQSRCKAESKTDLSLPSGAISSSWLTDCLVSTQPLTHLTLLVTSFSQEGNTG